LAEFLANIFVTDFRRW